MSAAPRRIGLQKALFGLALAVLTLLQITYVVNMILWVDAPERGWRMFTDTGIHVVAMLRPAGEQAGLEQNDRILTLNGEPYETYDEFNALLHTELGSLNVLEVERGGQQLTIAVPVRPLGWRGVGRQSGLLWAVGLIFVAMGILVFLMKPYQAPSWAFLLMAALLGTYVAYSGPGPGARYFEPPQLSNTIFVATSLLAAAVIHLAACFPRRRAFVDRHPSWLAAPYALGVVLAGLVVARESGGEVPAGIENAIYLYGFCSLLVFLASTAQIYLSTRSQAERLQSLLIFTGSLIALLVPLTEQIYARLLGVRFFPDLILFSVLFLSVFPLSIGYAIVRHDLFEIDVIVRRTYGYLLSTGLIVALYGAMVSVLNLSVGPTDLLRSPFFSVAFVLGMVFVMQPLHGRVQRVVDRAFYRQQYDYRATITELSERMTSMLDPELVQRTLVDSLVSEMFLENGILLVPGEAGALEARVVQGSEPPLVRGQEADLDDALRAALLEKQVPVFRHEIELAPQYERRRQEMAASFGALDAELMLPMVYQGEVRAVLSLGRKKSGKMFTREDVDLLRTLVAQSSIAMENARLFDEVAANLRHIQLLESVKSNLSKFVPLTVQTLLEESPDAAGLFEKRERDLSVMFADMTGYTRLSSQLPMDQVNAIIERYFGAFLEEIIRHGGDVNETAGDGLMVLFQDEDPERHARAAVRAALGIQRLTGEINAERLADNPQATAVGMHIGVNSGIASVGATKIQGGGGARWTYTASGPTTNIAARVGALGVGIAITEETRGRLGEGFQIEEIGPQSLKNVAAPVLVYRVTGAEREVEEPAARPEVARPASTATGPGLSAEGRAHVQHEGRFAIIGGLRESPSGRALARHVVRAFDKDLVFDDYLGEAVTDAAGRFEILFTDEQFADLFEQQPDVYLRVYDPSGRRELESTERAVRWNAGTVETFEIEIPEERLLAASP